MTDHRKKSKLKKLKRKCENNALNIITKNKDFAWSSCKKFNNIEKNNKRTTKILRNHKKNINCVIKLNVQSPKNDHEVSIATICTIIT